jgi:hypothetical protein
VSVRAVRGYFKGLAQNCRAGYNKPMLRFSQNRLFTLALAVLFIFAVFFAEAFVFVHLDHDHSGEDCPVCLQIETAHNLFKALAPVAVFPLRPEGRVAALERFSFFSGLFAPDPVSLKVRFNS